jgi:hypothetical protein
MALTWQSVAAKVGSHDIKGIIEYDGNIYGVSDYTNLFRLDGGDTWTQVLPQYGTSLSSHGALAVFGSELFIGTSNDGKLLSYRAGIGQSTWSLCASQYSTQTRVCDLQVFGGELYAATGGSSTSYLLKWNGSNAWTTIADKISGTFDTRLTRMIEFNAKLYAGCYPSGKLAELSGSSLVDKGTCTDDMISCIIAHDSKLYLATDYDYGLLFEWNGTDTLTQKAGAYGSDLIYALISDGTSIYAGTDNGKCLKWNGTNAWDLESASFESSFQVSDLIIYSTDSKIYAASSSSSTLLRLEAPSNNVTIASDSFTLAGSIGGNAYSSIIIEGALSATGSLSASTSSCSLGIHEQTFSIPLVIVTLESPHGSLSLSDPLDSFTMHSGGTLEIQDSRDTFAFEAFLGASGSLSLADALDVMAALPGGEIELSYVQDTLSIVGIAATTAMFSLDEQSDTWDVQALSGVVATFSPVEASDLLNLTGQPETTGGMNLSESSDTLTITALAGGLADTISLTDWQDAFAFSGRAFESGSMALIDSTDLAVFTGMRTATFTSHVIQYQKARY